MAWGLETYNSAGVPVLRVTDRFTRIHSTYTVSLSYLSATTIGVSGMSNDGTWVAIPSEAQFECLVQSGQVYIQNHGTNGSTTTTIVVLKL